MLSTFSRRPNLSPRPQDGRRMYPRNCPTDVSSQSDIGATSLPPPIMVPKSKKRVYNQVESIAVYAARQVCVYVRCLDPSKYPVKPYKDQEAFDRYNAFKNLTSLPRGWSKSLPSDPYGGTGDPYWPYNSFLCVQARTRDVSQCRCSHYLPSKIDNNSGYFSIDFICGCPHKTGGFGSIPLEHNACPDQRAALGHIALDLA